MTTRRIVQNTVQTTARTVALALLATLPLAACAQAPVDDSGKVIGAYEPALAASNSDLAVGNEEIPLMSDVDLEVLVGPIALYPDDLLAIVLPASAYPLQIIDAARFLEELESDSSLKPNPDWDDSVVALLNYPEVIELLNDDIDWTWRLGEAVVSQQGDVVGAIESFRDRAYAAGNLKSDSYQKVSRDEGIIYIEPIVEDVIYVPYYEPERVVVYQPRPVYYYYPRSYPVYYYPYSSAYSFNRGYFWGVTTAFTIGWMSDSLHVYHPSYYGHPYYGHSYRDRWWYRRPTMNVYNTNYVRNTNVTINRYNNGDRWSPRHDRRDYVRDERITRSRHYEHNRDDQTVHRRANRTQPDRTQANRTQANRAQGQASRTQANRTRPSRSQEPIEFRNRQDQRSDASQARNSQRTESRQQAERRSPAVVQRERQRSEPAVRQRQERHEPTRQARQEPRERAAPQQQAHQEPRQRAAPQRQTRQEPRERAAPQRQARQEPRERATPQRQTRQEPRERAAPQQQERSSKSREQKKRSARR